MRTAVKRMALYVGLFSTLLTSACSPEPEVVYPDDAILKKDLSGRGEHVIVIGAGIAGLTAARALKRAGVDVTVVEARDRLGGRIHTFREWGSTVELGASWLHGTKNNPLAKLADEAGVKIVHTDEFRSSVLFDGNGNRVGLWDSLVGAFYGFLTIEQVHHKADKSATNAPFEKVLQSIMKDREPSAVENMGLQFALAIYQNWCGGELNDLSAQTDPEAVLDGGNHAVADGFDRLVQYLAKGLDIQLGTEVTRIRYSATGVTIDTSRGSLTGDRVIVTVPLGVLKAGKIAFEPQLPERKRKAIDEIGYGLLEKVALHFPDAFWDDVDVISNASDAIGNANYVLNGRRVNGEPVLTALNSVPYAHSLQSMPDKAIVEAAAAVVQQNYREKFLDPTASVVTHWATDPYSLGSYSYDSYRMNANSRSDLAEPIMDRVFFAGEATHVNFFGTTHGAYWSGVFAAVGAAAAIDAQP